MSIKSGNLSRLYLFERKLISPRTSTNEKWWLEQTLKPIFVRSMGVHKSSYRQWIKGGCCRAPRQRRAWSERTAALPPSSPPVNRCSTTSPSRCSFTVYKQYSLSFDIGIATRVQWFRFFFGKPSYSRFLEKYCDPKNKILNIFLIFSANLEGFRFFWSKNYRKLLLQ